MAAAQEAVETVADAIQWGQLTGLQAAHTQQPHEQRQPPPLADGVEGAMAAVAAAAASAGGAEPSPSPSLTPFWGGAGGDQWAGCPNECSGIGICLKSNCYCPQGFRGADCGLRACPGDCSGRGVCSKEGVCTCTPPFFGDDCQQFVLPTPTPSPSPSPSPTPTPTPDAYGTPPYAREPKFPTPTPEAPLDICSGGGVAVEVQLWQARDCSQRTLTLPHVCAGMTAADLHDAIAKAAGEHPARLQPFLYGVPLARIGAFDHPSPPPMPPAPPSPPSPSPPPFTRPDGPSASPCPSPKLPAWALGWPSPSPSPSPLVLPSAPPFPPMPPPMAVKECKGKCPSKGLLDEIPADYERVYPPSPSPPPSPPAAKPPCNTPPEMKWIDADGVPHYETDSPTASVSLSDGGVVAEPPPVSTASAAGVAAALNSAMAAGGNVAAEPSGAFQQATRVTLASPQKAVEMAMGGFSWKGAAQDKEKAADDATASDDEAAAATTAASVATAKAAAGATPSLTMRQAPRAEPPASDFDDSFFASRGAKSASGPAPAQARRLLFGDSASAASAAARAQRAAATADFARALGIMEAAEPTGAPGGEARRTTAAGLRTALQPATALLLDEMPDDILGASSTAEGLRPEVGYGHGVLDSPSSSQQQPPQPQQKAPWPDAAFASQETLVGKFAASLASASASASPPAAPSGYALGGSSVGVYVAPPFPPRPPPSAPFPPPFVMAGVPRNVPLLGPANPMPAAAAAQLTLRQAMRLAGLPADGPLLNRTVVHVRVLMGGADYASRTETDPATGTPCTGTPRTPPPVPPAASLGTRQCVESASKGVLGADPSHKPWLLRLRGAGGQGDGAKGSALTVSGAGGFFKPSLYFNAFAQEAVPLCVQPDDTVDALRYRIARATGTPVNHVRLRVPAAATHRPPASLLQGCDPLRFAAFGAFGWALHASVPVCVHLASKRVKADLLRIGGGNADDGYAGGDGAPRLLLDTDAAAEAHHASRIDLMCEEPSPPPPPPAAPCGGVDPDAPQLPGTLCSPKPCKGCEKQYPTEPPVNAPGDPVPNEAYEAFAWGPWKSAHARFTRLRGE